MNKPSKPCCEPLYVIAGARPSPLSRAQVKEIQSILLSHFPHLHLIPYYVPTRGDQDRATSLRQLEKTDFFTKEIDEALLNGECRIAIHSAKDLPDPLPKGLICAALTKGIDPSDALVLRQNMRLEHLPKGAIVATSSERRERCIRAIRPDLMIVDIRGNIEERLAQLQEGKVDGVVIAEAALIRLKLTHLNRMRLSGEVAALQGKLAIVCRQDDEEIKALFTSIDQMDLLNQI